MERAGPGKVILHLVSCLSDSGPRDTAVGERRTDVTKFAVTGRASCLHVQSFCRFSTRMVSMLESVYSQVPLLCPKIADQQRGARLCRCSRRKSNSKNTFRRSSLYSLECKKKCRAASPFNCGKRAVKWQKPEKSSQLLESCEFSEINAS